MKHIIALAAVAAVGFGVMAATSSPASAAGCYYRLHQDGVGIITGKAAIQGYGHAVKTKRACKRARRECNRRFERARKKGWLPRGGPRDFRCVRTSTG